MTIYIKNMVSRLGVTIVESQLQALNIPHDGVALGKVMLKEPLSDGKLKQLGDSLLPYDFHIIEDHATITVERIKALIIEQIHYCENCPKPNFTKLLSEALGRHYSHLSQFFSNHEHITIEQFVIRQKIERAMELLENDELTITEIAARLHYSSVAHLSTQFKQLTGFTPTTYRREHPQIRRGRDSTYNIKKNLR